MPSFVLALAAVPSTATGYMHECPSFAEHTDTATVVVHPRQIGMPAGASDADVFTDDFEIRFDYQITVRSFDDNNPSGSRPVLCSFSGSFEHGWDMPDIRTN